MLDLRADSPLTELSGVGPVRCQRLAAAGLQRVGDLMMQLPARYEDRRRRTRIADIARPGRILVEGRLTDLRRLRIRRRGLSMVRGVVEDAGNRLPVLWFNQPYLFGRLVEGDRYSLYGPVRERGAGWELVNPSCEPIAATAATGEIVPIYRPCEGLSGAVLRKLITQAIDRGALQTLSDSVPPELRARHGLPDLATALGFLHQPPVEADVEALMERRTPAQARLSYGEMLELQVELTFLRELEIRRPKRHRYLIGDPLYERFEQLLPFELTRSQKTTLEEILGDLAAPQPMLRLLQGDVGCGKTIVAALALVAAMESGLQGALMAPTELLAEQHFQSLSGLLSERYRLGLLTGSAGDRAEVRREVADGAIGLVVGTHTLIQSGLQFRRLGLAVVDEQHRFGVTQRRLLQSKGDQPDLLVMTATPIPRSLALTVYGDLALSIIDEQPPGRRPISTRVVPARMRGAIYDWLIDQLGKGAQAYVVFPLVGESDKLSIHSLDAQGEELRGHLGDFESAVIHGRMEAIERQAIMRRFREGRIRVLLATTVIEVGVDVPNASIMLIESGERFGLSQLHQLRGRVGRGARRSHCVVIHGRLSDDARRRLAVFAGTDDGFRIAEADMEIRGPGDLLGTRQSGLPMFSLADIVRDRRWLEKARGDAHRLVGAGQRDADSDFLEAMRQRARKRYESFSGG